MNWAGFHPILYCRCQICLIPCGWWPVHLPDKTGEKKPKEKKTLGQNQWFLALFIFKSLQHSQSLAQTKLSPRAKEFPKVLVATLLAYLWKLSKNRVGENGSVETGVLKRLEHTILTYFKIRFVDQVRKETQLFSPIPPTLHHPPAPFL
jgi:hypothetical protein